MPKVAVVIPARYASTRFPGKSLHPIGGKPLIQHVWERCAKARGIETVIVATDDIRIAEAAFAFGAEVSMTSPRHRSGTDRCAEVAKRLRTISHLINVQGDEPLIDPALISRLASALRKDRDIEMITAASEFRVNEDRESSDIVKVVLDRQSDALYFSRSAIPNLTRAAGSTARAATLRHIGIYGYAREFLLRFVKWKPGRLEQIEHLEQLRALENGARIRVLMTKTASIGVDTPEDVAVVERLLG